MQHAWSRKYKYKDKYIQRQIQDKPPHLWCCMFLERRWQKESDSAEYASYAEHAKYRLCRLCRKCRSHPVTPFISVIHYFTSVTPVRRHPCQLCQDPDSILWTFLEQLALVLTSHLFVLKVTTCFRDTQSMMNTNHIMNTHHKMDTHHKLPDIWQKKQNFLMVELHQNVYSSINLSMKLSLLCQTLLSPSP